jgi:hypothetical protein
MVHSPAALIDATGVSVMAEKLKMRAGTIRMWKHRNTLPRSAWPELARAFPDLTLDKLQKIEAKGGRA